MKSYSKMFSGATSSFEDVNEYSSHETGKDYITKNFQCAVNRFSLDDVCNVDLQAYIVLYTYKELFEKSFKHLCDILWCWRFLHCSRCHSITPTIYSKTEKKTVSPDRRNCRKFSF